MLTRPVTTSDPALDRLVVLLHPGASAVQDEVGGHDGQGQHYSWQLGPDGDN